MDTPLAPLPRNLLDAIAQAGVDVPALARRTGLAPGQLETGVSRTEADRFLCAAWDALADPAFGLTAGRMLRPERFSVVGIAAMSSPNLGVALERKARYNRLIWGDVYEVVRRAARATVRIAGNAPPRPYSQARIDLELSSMLTFARLVTGRAVAPLQVTLRQGPPGYRDRYTQVFGCPVAFGQPDDSVVFAAADLDLPLVSASSEVGAALVQAAESQLGRLAEGEEDGFLPRVEQAVRRLLRGGEPTLSAVAGQLHVGERTLQRRLALQGAGFAGLLDRVRRETALEHLRQRRVTVEEVAFLLGFATPSSFFRAFRRWTGQTPQAWRVAQG